MKINWMIQKMSGLFLILAFMQMNLTGYSQQFTLPLWGENMPNFHETDEQEMIDQQDVLKIRKVIKPEIEVFLPSKRMGTGQAVIICPGGGYAILNWDWEGTDIAKYLNGQGIAAIVLKYRLPHAKANNVTYKSPILDAQRAMRLVRHHAAEWAIDVNRIGVMGFSAGGHLAATLATHYDVRYAEPTDSIDAISARPDFAALVYPVVTFKDDYTDPGSRRRLLNNKLDSALINDFSNELQVDEGTPPTFIIQASDDPIVPVQNALRYYEALVKNHVEVEMHMYPTGGHGFALARDDAYLSTWTDRLAAWLKRH